MEAMPRHDPLPRADRRADYERAAEAWARYKSDDEVDGAGRASPSCSRSIYLKSFGEPMPLHMMIATIAGVGLTVLVGTGLMGLVFLSQPHRP